MNVSSADFHVLSDYTTVKYVGDKIIQTKVTHVERNGRESVERIEYLTYNVNGTLNKPTEESDNVVDILL